MKRYGLYLGMLLAVAGCSDETESDRTLDKAQQVQSAGEVISRGEDIVADGKSLEARGETIKQQGDANDGDRIIAEGKAKEKEGQELIDQGRHLRDK